MLPATHFVSVIFVDQPTFDEGAQNPLSRHGLNIGDGDRIQPAHGMKHDTLLVVRIGDGLEYPIDDAAMKTKFQWRLTSALSTLSEAAGTKMHRLVEG